jgi:hypothetical protein
MVVSSCKKNDSSTTVNPPTDNNTFLAPTVQLKKNAVLENFTGVRCQYGIEGLTIINTLETNFPGKIIVISLHTGTYATPAATWPNFTNTFGDSIAAQSQLTDYPAANLNRKIFGGWSMTAGGTAMGRGYWTNATTQVIAENAPVNIGAIATYNATTKILTVKVDLYYTADETAVNNINVAFLQNAIVGNQMNTDGTYSEYIHNNVLRYLLCGQSGDAVPAASTKTGTKYSKTYTYTVPDDYNGASIPPGGGAVYIPNCDVVVFVGRGQGEILNGIKVKVKY